MGQRDKIGDERLGIGGSHPEYGVIRVTVAIGILDGGLGLADATKTRESLRLGEGSTVIVGELAMQRGEQLRAACKETVAPEGDIPERGGLCWFYREIPVAGLQQCIFIFSFKT